MDFKRLQRRFGFEFESNPDFDESEHLLFTVKSRIIHQ
jgi:hypothetical protein